MLFIKSFTTHVGDSTAVMLLVFIFMYTHRMCCTSCVHDMDDDDIISKRCRTRLTAARHTRQTRQLLIIDSIAQIISFISSHYSHHMPKDSLRTVTQAGSVGAQHFQHSNVLLSYSIDLLLLLNSFRYYATNSIAVDLLVFLSAPIHRVMI